MNSIQSDFTKITLNKLKDILSIENNKILYSGINNLYDNYISKKILDSNISIESFVREQLMQSFKEDSVGYNKNDLLIQNINHDFFEYILDRFNGDTNEHIEKTMVSVISNYLKFCVDLYEIKNNDSINLYEQYGTLINDINKMINSDLCYIFYSDANGDKFLLSSHLDVKKNFNMFKDINQAYKIVDKHKLAQKNSDKLQYNTYCINDTDNVDDQTIISICIDLNNYNNGSKKSIFLVSFYDKLDDEKINEIKSNLIFPLSFRSTMQSVFVRDISQLLSCSYNYSYHDVTMLGKDELNILHLTDLHINDENSKVISDCIDKINFLEKIENKSYDLMIISGDVVQAATTANQLEKNYDLAKNIIKKIAMKIWTENSHLRNDWQKRIVIIPGNHDYAIMNELSAVQNARKLQYGYASTNEGSIMAKFTYYIDFIRKLQGVPIGNLIDNRLNEFREYDKMKLSICCLNSCFKENPKRTNKVKLDDEWIENLISTIPQGISIAKNSCIGVVHHAPEYNIDYFIDKQKINWGKAKINGIDIFDTSRRIKNSIYNDQKIDVSLMDSIKEVSESLYNNLLRYNDNINDDSEEYTSSFIFETKNDLELSSIDKINFRDKITKLSEKLKFDCMLCGHEHKENRYEFKYNVSNPAGIMDFMVYIGDKFYHYDKEEKKGSINFGILKLGKYDEKLQKYTLCDYDDVKI